MRPGGFGSQIVFSELDKFIDRVFRPQDIVRKHESSKLLTHFNFKHNERFTTKKSLVTTMMTQTIRRAIFCWLVLLSFSVNVNFETLST